MAKPQRGRKFGKRKRGLSSRMLYVAGLHRQPRRWDILVHELALAMAERYRQVRRELATDTFRFDDENARKVGWMLARGFEVLIGRGWPAGGEGGGQASLWGLDGSSADAVVARTRQACFGPLLRKYVEDTLNIFPGRPHGDMDKLVAALGDALGSFLASRCRDGGDLRGCLTDPLGDPGGYFAGNGKPADPARSCGDPARDVYLLGLTIHDGDDGGDVKGKLVHFVRTDPWLFAEWLSFVRQRPDEPQEGRPSEELVAVDDATDDFIFRATRLDGKTPIELLIERQPDLSERQRQRLLRWNSEAFRGFFLVKRVDPPFAAAEEVQTGKEYRLEATKAEAMRRLAPGDLLVTRVVPWDDHWLLSGIQQKYDRVGGKFLQELRDSLHRGPAVGRLDEDDPRAEKARQIQEEQYQAWIALFGREEVICRDGLELGAVLDRFHRHWAEMVLPGTGLSRAESFRQRTGRAPPPPKFSLPEELLGASDVAAVFDRLHGLSFYVGYGEFRTAFEGEGPLTKPQAERVWDYLTDESVDYWIFHRMRDGFPQRAEQVLRRVLRDESFSLERDLGRLLRKFKGQAMRRPERPMITVVDVQPAGKVSPEGTKP